MPDRDVEKWDAIHGERGFFPPLPSQHIARCEAFLPKSKGAAMDVAGGSGRHAMWLAERGFEVTLADISPTALCVAGEEADKRNLALKTLRVDLEEEPFPCGPWDVILSFHYLHRPLFESFARTLSSGGILIFVQPTMKNLERHPRPSAQFLLAEGELLDLAAKHGLEAVAYEEDWSADQRHEAFMIAKRQRVR